MTARVLIIEDEPNLRSSMARGLSRLEGVEVVDSGTLGGALALIDERAPRVILSDIDLPDRSGIEILGELGRRGLRVPVVFISAYLKAYGSQIPRHADVEVREKPVELDELRRIVLSKVEEDRSGQEPAPFSVTDYVQIACLGRRSVVIEVTGPGPRRGTIVVTDGMAWSARDGEDRGETAFRRLVFRPDANVACRALRGDPGEQDLFERWEQLLIEAARVQDEEQAGAEPTKPLPSAAEDTEERAYAELWDEGVSALLRKDYPAALRTFLRARAMRPDDKRVSANLERLRQLGVKEE